MIKKRQFKSVHSFLETSKEKFRAALFLLLFAGLFSGAGFAKTTTQILEEIPVQHNGRIKPFQSFAEEVSLSILGQREWKGEAASQRVFEWIAMPEKAANQPLLQVPKILQSEFPLMVIGGRISPELVLNNEAFFEKAKAADARRSAKEKLPMIDTKRLELYERASLFQQVASGAQPGWIAHPEDPRIGWLTFESLKDQETWSALVQLFPETQVAKMETARLDLLKSLKDGFNTPSSFEAMQDFRASMKELLDSRGIRLDENHLALELFYNRAHAFRWAWGAYLIAALFFFLAQASGKKIFGFAGIGFFVPGFLIHLLGFVLRCLIAGRPPVTNMYESLIWVSWAVILFSGVLYGVYKTPLLPGISSVVAAFALILSESFPAVLDPTISPLVPVLRSNYWLTIHVLTITLSYGAFALAWGLGHAALISYMMKPAGASEMAAKLSTFVYRSVQIGVILLATGTVLGGVWANYSWGRFWGWDPKETWALIALLGYLVILHGRFMGWLDSFGMAAGAVAGFLGVVMAWYGVNFVLAAGLHSYGFGGGGAPYVITIALLDLAFVGILSWIYKTRKIKMAQTSVV